MAAKATSLLALHIQTFNHLSYLCLRAASTITIARRGARAGAWRGSGGRAISPCHYLPTIIPIPFHCRHRIPSRTHRTAFAARERANWWFGRGATGRRITHGGGFAAGGGVQCLIILSILVTARARGSFCTLLVVVSIPPLRQKNLRRQSLLGGCLGRQGFLSRGKEEYVPVLPLMFHETSDTF